MSYWTWPQAKGPSHNTLEPREFNETGKEEPKKHAPAPAEKKVKADGTVAGYVCLIHEVEEQK